MPLRLFVFFFLLLVALGLAGCDGKASTRGSQGFGAGALIEAPPPDAAIASLEREMFERLNEDRRRQGLPALVWDDTLAAAGRAHSLDMRDAGFFAHESPSTGSLEARLTRLGYLFATARENLALGPDVQRAQDGLLESPGHHANIMADDVASVGIGIVRGASPQLDAETLYITQVFARQLEALDADAARSTVVQRLDEARRAIGLGVAQHHEALDALAGDIAARDGRPRSDEIERVALALHDGGLPVGSVGAVSVQLYALEDFEVVPTLLDESIVAIGVGSAQTRDEAGRPVVALVVLIASRL